MPGLTTRVRAVALGALGAVALVAVACGGSDDGSDGAAPAVQATPSAAATPSTTADALASGPGFTGEGTVLGVGEFNWLVTRVDAGTKPDIALRPDGTPLIAYMLERRGAAGFVRVATASGDGFSVETLQDGYVYGPLDIEISSDGQAAVAYHNHDWEDAAVAVLRGGTWEIDRINDGGHDGWHDALAFGPDGGLHLLAVDPSQFGATEGVEYAALRDGEWSVEPIGSGAQPYEWGVDIAVDSTGALHAVYFDATGRDLMYAFNDGTGGGWVIERIYENGDAGRFAVLALDATDRPHVAFFQSDADVREEGRNSGSVVYGAFDGTAWAFETVGTLDNQVLGFEGARRTVALEVGVGGPVIAFIDESRLAVGSLADGVWSVETVLDAGADPFQIVGLALDGAGAPHLTFSTVTGHSPLDGEIWYVAPVSRG